MSEWEYIGFQLDDKRCPFRYIRNRYSILSYTYRCNIPIANILCVGYGFHVRFRAYPCTSTSFGVRHVDKQPVSTDYSVPDNYRDENLWHTLNSYFYFLRWYFRYFSFSYIFRKFVSLNFVKIYSKVLCFGECFEECFARLHYSVKSRSLVKLQFSQITGKLSALNLHTNGAKRKPPNAKPSANYTVIFFLCVFQ